ncbi:hypothetical protein BKA70DRAFT_1423402 [Coprinopsis sp. MPI-PUGE-AT-0042]|nr:hypothetical protein BKA70DRAFT_1423402 [Coprinopsis sp. MPI-PUGE-AT-0042]
MSTRRQTRAAKTKAAHKSPPIVNESEYEDPIASPATPTPATPKRKRGTKEATFTVPPLKLAATDSPIPSPSKKPRKALPEHDALSPVPQSQEDENVFVEKEDSQALASGEEEDGPSTYSEADERSKSPGQSPEPAGPNGMNDGMTDPVYEETIVKNKKVIKIGQLPSVCAFSDRKLFDPVIVKKAMHLNLPALPNYILTSYKEASVQEVDPNSGEVLVPRVTVSSLLSTYKHLQKEYIISLVEFVQADGLANPARADPRSFMARQGYCKPDSETYELAKADGSKIMTWVSLVVVSDCQIVHGITPTFGDSPKKLLYKFVAGIGIQGESDRAESFFPTCFGHESLVAEFAEGGLVYQTRNKRTNVPVDEAPTSSSPRTPNSKARAAPQTPVSKSTSMLGKLQLTNISGRPRPTPANPLSGYDFTADVPIYDGRESKIVPEELLSTVLTLKKWRGEIPRGSCVLIVYNAQANQYKEYPWKLTLYIRFAVVIGSA